MHNEIKVPHVSSLSNSNKYYDIVSIIDDFGNRRNGRVNRLVLMAFKPLCDYSNFDAHHINENTQDNRLCNLEWKTHLENCREHYFLINGEDNYLYNDENIHKICKGLEMSLPFEQIANKILKVEYNDTIKAYISAVRAKKIRKDISNQYHFPTKMRNNALLSDNQIHEICKYMAAGYNSTDIINIIFPNLNDNKFRISLLNLMQKIKGKYRFTRISDLYF
jgi:hypothetical protein